MGTTSMNGDDWCFRLEKDLDTLEYEYQMLDEQYEEALRRYDEVIELLRDAAVEYASIVGYVTHDGDSAESIVRDLTLGLITESEAIGRIRGMLR